MKVFRRPSSQPATRQPSMRTCCQPLEIEQLEDRLLLSGNVNVIASGNDLVLIGDGGNNSIEITATDDGINISGNDNTRINGGRADFLAFANTSRVGNVVIDAATGDNTFSITGNMTVNGSVRFVSQGGRDQFGISDVQIGGDLDIYTGKGSDSVALRDVNVGDDVSIRTRMGFNVISARRLNVADDVEIFTELQDDRIVFEDSQLGGDVRAYTGDGIDTIAFRNTSIGNHLDLAMGDGSDFVSFDNAGVGNNALISLAAGDDVVDISSGSIFRDHVKFIDGRGNDHVQVANSTFNAGQTRLGIEFRRVPAATVNAALTDPRGAFPKAAVAQEILGDDAGGANQNSLALTTDVSANGGTVTSGLTLVGENQFVINGMTAPNAIVQVARDADGLFDDATTTADASGNYSVTVELQNDGEGNGANPLQVRAAAGGRSGVSEQIDVHFAAGTVVDFETSLGNVQVELLDEAAPGHVANFLAYQERYANSFVQRSDRGSSPDGFIIQAGRYVLDGSDVEEIVRDATIDSEFSGIVNDRGTLALALPSGNADGGSSEYFFNVADNASILDQQNFTVFGRVIGNGMQIVDVIHELPIFDLNAVLEETALGDLPLIDYVEFTGQLTGTASVSEGTDASDATIATITGAGTQFTTELVSGQQIRIGGQVYTVNTIDSDTSLATQPVTPIVVDNSPIEVNVAPAIENYVIINSISELQI